MRILSRQSWHFGRSGQQGVKLYMSRFSRALYLSMDSSTLSWLISELQMMSKEHVRRQVVRHDSRQPGCRHLLVCAKSVSMPLCQKRLLQVRQELFAEIEWCLHGSIDESYRWYQWPCDVGGFCMFWGASSGSGSQYCKYPSDYRLPSCLVRNQ
jgi:hypothetical protein